jgi:TRAP-type C4-dicarboxylate transport system permease small subunit
MKGSFAWVAVAFFIIAPLWYGYVVYRDLTHPETWDADWTRDPRGYLLCAVPVGAFMLFAWRYIRRTAKRVREQERYLEQLRECNRRMERGNEQAR